MCSYGDRTSATSIFIVCEGSKSEPWFLRRFIKWVQQDSARGVVDYRCDIYPAPETDEEASDGDVVKSGRKSGGRKPAGKADADAEEKPQGGNPLLWVEHGISKLGSYSEVYVVFDKDGHPNLPAAFGKVKDLKKANRPIEVIFNSRSFEYYMLLHFENIYRTFTETECGEKQGRRGHKHTRTFKCCLEDADPRQCEGAVCINGYARLNGYWSDSKDENTFDSALNIWAGMARGEKVAVKALTDNPGVDEYDLNPYTDFQKLLARLSGRRILRCGESVSVDVGNKHSHDFTYSDGTLIVANNSPIPLKLAQGWLKTYSLDAPFRLKTSFRAGEKFTEEEEKMFAEYQAARNLIREEPAISIAPGEEMVFELHDPSADCVFSSFEYKGVEYMLF